MLGFVIGLFEFARLMGIATLGIIGGLAVGVRIVMFREGLLIPMYSINWVIVGGCGLGGLVLVVVRQRIGIVSSLKLFLLLSLNSALAVIHSFNG